MFYHVYTTTVPIHTHTLFADNSLIHGKCSRFYLLKPYMYHITNKSLFKYDCNHVYISIFIDLMLSVLNILWQIKIKASVMKMTNLLFIVRNCINDILLRARYTRYTSVRCIMTKTLWTEFLFRDDPFSLPCFFLFSTVFHLMFYIVLKLFFEFQKFENLSNIILKC